jgi:hypothetical protein
MTTVGDWMKTNDVRREPMRDARRTGAAPADWSGIGWTDSSWDLARGLEVVEDLPPDAWPAELLPPQGLKS